MSEFYDNEYADRLHPFISQKLFKKMTDIFNEESLNSIKDESSKLRTYALFKTDLGLEPYLLDIKNFKLRSKVTKFRLSNHKLRIETGRRDKIPKQERFCRFCPTEVEDEYHFLFRCPIYQNLRQLYILPITSSLNGFETLPDSTKIKHVMSATDFKIYKFLSDGMDLRTFLISEYKRRD